MTYIAANKNYDELNLIYTLSLFYYNVYLGLSKSIDKSKNQSNESKLWMQILQKDDEASFFAIFVFYPFKNKPKMAINSCTLSKILRMP